MTRWSFGRSSIAAIVAILATATSVRAQTAEVAEPVPPAPIAEPAPPAPVAEATADAAPPTSTRLTLTADVANSAADTRPTIIAAAAREDDFHLLGDGLLPLVSGGIAGSALAIAFESPRHDDTKVSPSGDGATAIASIGSGIALAFLANGTSGSRYPGRLRATAGSSSSYYWEYELAYRVPIASRFAIEAGLLVGNDFAETTEKRTECWLFGCITLDHILRGRYEQMGAAMARAVYEPLLDYPFGTSISIGAGPSLARIKYVQDTPMGFVEGSPESHTGMQCDATLSLQLFWLTADMGVRVGLGTGSGTDTAGFFRVGYTLGDRAYRPSSASRR